MVDKEITYAIEHGILDLPGMHDQVELMKRKEIIEKHPYSIFQSTNGYWKTTVEDSTKKNGRRQIQRKTREEVEDEIVKYYRARQSVPTVRKLYENWISYKSSQIRPATVYKNDGVFKRHYETPMSFGRMKNVVMADMHIDKLSESDWQYFLEARHCIEGTTVKAFANLKGITKGFLIKAKRDGYIEWSINDMFDGLQLKRLPKKEKDPESQYYSDDEISAIMDYCRGNPDIRSLCIQLIIVTGLRDGEATTLKHDDIDPKECCVRVRRTESRYKDTSTGKMITYVEETTKTEAGIRTVYVPRQYKELLSMLYMQSSGREWVFARPEDGERLTEAGVRHKLGRICEKLGIKYRSPHKIRKTYASILKNQSGLSDKQIESQLGHVDISTTEKYYNYDRSGGKDKVEELSKIEAFV